MAIHFRAPSDAITVVHRALQESPKARDDLLVKGDALLYAKRVLDRSTIGVSNGRYITLPDKSDPNQPSACDPSPTAVITRISGSLGSEIDNAFTLLHAAPTRPAPMSA
jgi:hypothetical protein